MNMRNTVGNLLGEIRIELDKSTQKHGEMASAHEGFAIIAEELDELWDHVKGDTAYTEDAYKEAIQIAAMGAKFAQMIADRNGWQN